eukprot:scaffold625_cov202-Alexandrium_tamarense.AAC.18
MDLEYICCVSYSRKKLQQIRQEARIDTKRIRKLICANVVVPNDSSSDSSTSPLASIYDTLKD